MSKELTPYKRMLGVYQEMKALNKTLGGARSWVLSNNDQLPKDNRLTPLQVNILKATKKAENYKIFAQYVRTHHKSGTYSPFYVLQAIVKHEAKFQEMFFPAKVAK